MILDYQSNQQVTVRQSGPDSFECRGRLDDTLFGAEVVLTIKVPALDIAAAEFEIKRSFTPLPEELKENFQKLVGVRTGQGLTRIVRGLVGGPQGSDRLAALVMDTAEGLILSFTTGPLRPALAELGQDNPLEEDRELNPKVMGREHIDLMATQNPRMKDSCIAFRSEEGDHA